MERQWVKCLNPECGIRYSFVGFKTGIGKTKKELKELVESMKVCRYCRKETLKDDQDAHKHLW